MRQEMKKKVRGCLSTKCKRRLFQRAHIFFEAIHSKESLWITQMWLKPKRKEKSKGEG